MENKITATCIVAVVCCCMCCFVLCIFVVAVFNLDANGDVLSKWNLIFGIGHFGFPFHIVSTFFGGWDCRTRTMYRNITSKTRFHRMMPRKTNMLTHSVLSFSIHSQRVRPCAADFHNRSNPILPDNIHRCGFANIAHYTSTTIIHDTPPSWELVTAK